MADLVLGLAKSTVEGTLSLVKTAIETEDNLQKGVKRDLMLISDEFHMMSAFLSDTKVRVSDNMARTIVRQVREMSLDAEDCVEFVVQFDTRSAWWRHLFPRCMQVAAPVVALDQAVANIEQLKTRVESMGQRNMRYNHIHESDPKFAEQAHQQALALVEARGTTGRLRSRVNLVKLINRAEILDDADNVKEHKENEKMKEGDDVEEEKKEEKAVDEVKEEEKQRDEVKEEENEDEVKEEVKEGDEFKEEEEKEKMLKKKKDEKEKRELQVISVLATRNDMGLISIRKAYDDNETMKGFTCRAWVKLMHPFVPHVFLQSLLAQFHQNNIRGQQDNTVDIMEPMDLMLETHKILIDEFRKQIKHKYLIVLEDVSSMVDWDAARSYLPDNNNGSCIIVHTQQPGIAGMSVGHIHQVSELENADHPIYLIYKTDKENVLEATKKMKEKKEEASDWFEDCKIVGRQEHMRDLEAMIKENEETNIVISLWGIPGVGKSTLIKSVYSKIIVEGTEESPYQNFGWADVSYPFNLKQLAWTLLVNLQSESRLSILEIKDPIQGCRQFLQENKCLIVIDGLQSKDEWDLIKNSIASKEFKTFIIVITNDERVAKYCTDYMANLNGLEAHYALELLQNKTDFKDLIPQQMKEAKLMLHKCGGLPKVIVSISDYFGWGGRRLPHQEVMWMRLCDRFVHELETNQEDLRDLFAWMQSYFHNCSDLLKPCLIYLTIFPANFSIRRRRLLRRWIAEGYSRETDEEETTEELFSQLVKFNIIQQENWSSIPTETLCRINGFFREYIKSRSMEEDHIFALEGPRSMMLKPTGRHLTIGSDWKREKHVFDSIDHHRLRSLTVFGTWEPYLICEDMRVLRVLDLEGTSGINDVDVEKMVTLLPRLRFLSLRGCKGVTHLAHTSLGGLTLLQTLDIRDTSICELPKSIAKLHKLQYIRAGIDTSMTESFPAAAVAQQVVNTSSITATERIQPPAVAATAVAETAAAAAAAAAAMAATTAAAAAATAAAAAAAAAVAAAEAAAAAAAEPSSSVTVGRLPPPPAAAAAAASTASRSRYSLLSKLRKSRQHGHGVVDGSHSGGVKVPGEIFGALPDMHTLGVVNMSSSRFDRIKLLTRLHKLGVSGINRSNSREFFAAISGLQHLQSLSVHLDKDNQAGCFYDTTTPPKSLRSLKLYGPECKVPSWINDDELPFLSKLSLQVPTEGSFRICEKPMELLTLRLYLTGGGEFCTTEDEKISFVVLDITCNPGQKAVRFRDGLESSFESDTVLKVRCRGGVSSSLQFSGVECIPGLKEVWLSGAYKDDFKEHMDTEIQQCQRKDKKPVFLRQLE